MCFIQYHIKNVVTVTKTHAAKSTPMTITAIFQPEGSVLYEAEIVLDKAEFVLDKAEFVAYKAEVVLYEAEFVLYEAEVELDKAEVVLDKAEVVPYEAEVVLYEAEVVLDKAEVPLLYCCDEFDTSLLAGCCVLVVTACLENGAPVVCMRKK